ncbi:MAG: hypothetical protein QGG84_10150, partial [Rhodospirillales bacterium]|nr:hypothetical protein [Rhodospirillales bacterium]
TIFATQLRFSHFPLQWLPEDNFARIATETVDENLRGSLTLEVIVDTGQTNGLYNPDIARKIDEVAKFSIIVLRLCLWFDFSVI